MGRHLRSLSTRPVGEYDRRASAADSRATAGLCDRDLPARTGVRVPLPPCLPRSRSRRAPRPRERAPRRDQPRGGPHRRTDRASQPARADRRSRDAGWRTPATSAASSSRSSTSTASSSTTTPSATRPATRCSPASASAWRPPWTESAAPTAWAATSSASSPRSSLPAPTPWSRSPPPLCRTPATRSRSAARTAWRSCRRRRSLPADALRIADQRMYEQKASPSSVSRQSTDVLLKVLSERDSELRDHLSSVAGLAERIAETARARRARGQADRRSRPSCTTSARPRSRTRS